MNDNLHSKRPYDEIAKALLELEQFIQYFESERLSATSQIDRRITEARSTREESVARSKSEYEDALHDISQREEWSLHHLTGQHERNAQFVAYVKVEINRHMTSLSAAYLEQWTDPELYPTLPIPTTLDSLRQEILELLEQLAQNGDGLHGK